ncbi:hypothetical protein P3T76_004266 [Phytophthora citrophthora]|uniref:Uncharacterized protein n=1 Tax=Phytophthora citrophthora TaxID=4793 RepID=A0AAD9GSN6_9STRA|nr:hypothetical protein P3T76_004266 [Phytophthora citrophthora]
MDEDNNVVGNLFLQNGEDNSYDPEDFVQELDVGDSAPRFRISVADDDGGIPGSLFACAVWNGAVCQISIPHDQQFVEQLELILSIGFRDLLPCISPRILS